MMVEHRNGARRAGELGQREPLRVAVVLSRRLASAGSGLDLEGLLPRLASTLGEVRAYQVSDLRQRPAEITEILSKSDCQRLVLGLASGEYVAGQVQRQVRKAGLDPLGMEVVNLEAHAARPYPRPVAMARALLLLAGAVARARARPVAGAEHEALSLSVTVSRRALFRLALHEYRVVPAVIADRCVAAQGCRQCASACPRAALRVGGHSMELEKSRCESCGLCASVCPSGAIDDPAYSADILEAELGALLDAALSNLTPRGVLFGCRRSMAALEERDPGYAPGWLPVIVPCAGMLSPAWLLRPLALGAAGVRVVPCAGQCPFAQDGVVGERIAFCQELLGLMGAPPGTVNLCRAGGDRGAWALPVPAGGRPGVHVSEPPAGGRGLAAETVLALARAHAAPPDLVLEHPQAPFGNIELDSAGCTGCENCARACPSGALSASHEQGVTIDFDSARCAACGLCVPRCPETKRGVLRLRRAVDLPRLSAGRVTLYRARAATCEACGSLIAPNDVMARITQRLGEEDAALAAVLARYCPACRIRRGSGRRSSNP